VFSKADLVSPGEVAKWCQRAARWGYDALAISTCNGEGLKPLLQRLVQPGIAVLCGPSGVGKSSVLNGLCPELGLRVAAVSGRLQRGRHTTRHVELFPLAPGALLADTPGFNRPRLPEDQAALGPLFPEIRQRLERGCCRFSNCLHQGDPGCVVGSDWERYPLYAQCLSDLLLESERIGRVTDSPEGSGQRHRGQGLEPRLAPGLRQLSRRRQRQQLLDGEEDGEARTETGRNFSRLDPAD
jgi:ribosome biogenesis GTPase / thiamine phosphate phosphatase